MDITRDSLVLSTVNAPHRPPIDAETLAECVRSASPDAWVWTVHVTTLFVDVRPDLVIEFAGRHGIDADALARCYIALRDQTGERSPALEAELRITQPLSCS